MGGMKYLLFIVLLVAVIITAGCVGGNQNSAVTPTPQIVYVTVLVTPIPTPTSTPQIVYKTVLVTPTPTTSLTTIPSLGRFPSTLSNNKRQITIYSVQKTSTYNWMGTSNSLAQKSQTGKTYITIDAEVKYLGVIGISSIYTGPHDFSISDIDGNRYDAEPYMGDDAFEILKELSKNQKTRGKVVFAVPTDANGLTLSYDYGNLVPWGEKSATWDIN